MNGVAEVSLYLEVLPSKRETPTINIVFVYVRIYNNRSFTLYGRHKFIFANMTNPIHHFIITFNYSHELSYSINA